MCCEEFCLFFSEALNLDQVLEELTALNKLHDEVNAEVILEDILHAHEEGVIVRVENVLLQVDVLDLLVLKH